MCRFLDWEARRPCTKVTFLSSPRTRREALEQVNQWRPKATTFSVTQKRLPEDRPEQFWRN